MLRATHVSRIARRATLGVGGLVTVGGSVGLGVYASSEQGQGFRREYRFWRKVFPIVFDYFWRTSSYSPYVRYRNLIEEKETIGNEHDECMKQQKKQQQRRKELLAKLHDTHAPEMLEVMLELKGLYVKLGQVLSVTALPVPEAYREQFRTLQSDVAGWEPFEEVVKPVIETELGVPMEQIFSSFDPVPCGAASIGQAHRAKLLPIFDNNSDNDEHKQEETEVIVKVQYPDARWQVPADIQCIGDLLKICVWFGVVDESAARLSFDEFSRQFLAELDYDQERKNLQEVHASSCSPDAPYLHRGVLVPEVYETLCSKRVITMSYLPGPKLEVEAKRQLELLGIDTSRGFRSIVRDSSKNVMENNTITTQLGDTHSEHEKVAVVATSTPTKSFKIRFSTVLKNLLGVDSVLWAIRLSRSVILWSTTFAVTGIRAVSSIGISLPEQWESWAEAHGNAAQQAERLSHTAEWIDALFDVHGHQIFNLGLFNADPHPGNILVIDDSEEVNDYQGELFHERNYSGKGDIRRRNMLGLIDYGQCKRLTGEEQVKVATLILSVANEETDHSIATAFRNLGVKTKNNSTEFLAKFARLMFGRLLPEHLDHAWHKSLHETDKLLYFPNELSMVYRTAMLLRGLGLSLQLNYSVGEKWRDHAQATIDREISQ